MIFKRVGERELSIGTDLGLIILRGYFSVVFVRKNRIKNGHLRGFYTILNDRCRICQVVDFVDSRIKKRRHSLRYVEVF